MVNVEGLRRNQIFKKNGVIAFEPEYASTSGKKKMLRGFTEVPGFIPFEVRHDKPEEVKKQLETAEEGKNSVRVMKLLDKEQIQMGFLVGDVTAIPKVPSDPYADIDLQKNLKPLKPVKITFDKPVAIIINPNSGKKRDVRALISSSLT